MFRLENILNKPLEQMNVDELSDVVKRLDARQKGLSDKQHELEQFAVDNMGYDSIKDAKVGLKAYGTGKIRADLDDLRAMSGVTRTAETAKALDLYEGAGRTYLQLVEQQQKNTELFHKADKLLAEKTNHSTLYSHAYRG